MKLAFKAAGMPKIDAREQAIAVMQEFLTPKAKPKSEDRAHLSKEFLKAAQSGALVEMELMLKAHPSVLAARSSSKGYTAMHYAAMAGAIPVLEWLTSQGLSPEVLSLAIDGATQLTPSQIADEYKRGAVVERLRTLADGVKFFKAAHAEDDDSRLRVAARGIRTADPTQPIPPRLPHHLASPPSRPTQLARSSPLTPLGSRERCRCLDASAPGPFAGSPVGGAGSNRGAIRGRLGWPHVSPR